jgi:hypothetical protein
MAIVKKFLSSYEGSNIPSTKRATKLMPTIVNYVKGEIVSQKKQKASRSAEDENSLKEFHSLFRNDVLYEIIGINAMAVLFNIGCIKFTTEMEIYYDKTKIDFYITKTDFPDKDLTYHPLIAEQFKKSPLNLIKAVISQQSPPILALSKDWLKQTEPLPAAKSLGSGT